MSFKLIDFIRESNRIESIHREPTDAEIVAHVALLNLPNLTVETLEFFVSEIQPDAVLRDEPGLNVGVGNHVAPPGGPEIRESLAELLEWCGRIHGHSMEPWAAHVKYETLHPFTDGNGRSGRAIWLWMMGGKAPLGFLHQFYYQTLASSRIET